MLSNIEIDRINQLIFKGEKQGYLQNMDKT